MFDSYSTVALFAPRKRKPRPKTEDLSGVEYETLRALDAAIRQYSNPTIKEIASCSQTVRYPSMVHKYLRRLRDKGWVALPEARRSRGIRMLRDLPECAA